VKRRTNLISTLILVSATFPALLAQDLLKSQPSPALPSEILGPQLIAWSQLQKPQPISQPTPSPGRPSAQPEQQPAQSAAPPQPPSPAAQTFTGTIVKDGGKYILKASGTNVYQLDDQERAKQYEGKQVKIGGTLDATGSSLHVTSIELLS
jgi:hypothetical protein